MLGRGTRLQCELHRSEHGLFVVQQHQRQDLDHLAIATRAFEQCGLQASEALWQFGERCAVTQRTGLTLQHREVVVPVIDCAPRKMATVDVPHVLGNHLAFGHEHEPIGIDAQTDGPVGKRRRYAVAVALEGHQAGW